MNPKPLVLIDPVRAELFTRLGPHGLLTRTDHEHVVGQDGVPWAVWRAGSQAVAVCGLGPGWVFTSAGRELFDKEWAAVAARFERADVDGRRAMLGEQVACVRLGELARRLCWFIHGEVVAQKTSLLHIPDVELAAACFGSDRDNWPPHWRQEVLGVARGLTRVHFTHCEPGSPPPFGASTVALTYVADLKGAEYVCPPECPWYGRGRHEHVEIDVGPGFLGALETFGSVSGDGVRTYSFPVGRRKERGPSLRTLGQEGRVREYFVPAYLGDPEVCERFKPDQIRLLQCICRERTRTRKGKNKSGAPLIVEGGRIPGFNGAGTVTFPGFEPNVRYFGFNGNGHRSGFGYRLFTDGGWMAKAGYMRERSKVFFADLCLLAGLLELVVIGVTRSGRIYTLTEMAAHAGAPFGRTAIGAADVRVYAPEGYIDRWAAHFCWPPPVPAASNQAELILRFELVRKERGLSRREAAKQLVLNPSFLNKLVQGKKKWPDNVAVRVEDWTGACATQEESDETTA